MRAMGFAGKFVVIYIMVFVFMVGCGSAMKSGVKLYEAGQYDEAVRTFKTALRKKPNNVDAKIWLDKAKNKAAEEHYAKALKAEENQQWTRAAAEYKTVLGFVSDYQDASQRLKKMESADALEHYQKGVAYQEVKQWDRAIEEFQSALQLVDNYQDSLQRIQEVKKAAAEEHYQRALSVESGRKWEEALDEYQKVQNYVSDYKDVLARTENIKTKLAEIAYQEASGLTQQAEKNNSVRQYRKALKVWERCLGYQPNYQDAQAIYKKVRKGATVSVCIMPFEGADLDAANLFTQKLIASSVNEKPELMSFVDRQYVAGLLLNEQDLASLGVMNAASAARIGQLANIHTFVVGEAPFTSTEVPAESTQKTSQGNYVSIHRIGEDGKRSTYNDWVDISYSLWTKSNQVDLQISYQILNAIDGTIISADSVSFSKSDEARWVTDITRPANITDISFESINERISKEEKVTVRKNSESIQSQLDAQQAYRGQAPEKIRKEPKAIQSLLNEAMDSVASGLASNIIAEVESVVE